jgi:hypothetical protein
VARSALGADSRFGPRTTLADGAVLPVLGPVVVVVVVVPAAAAAAIADARAAAAGSAAADLLPLIATSALLFTLGSTIRPLCANGDFARSGRGPGGGVGGRGGVPASRDSGDGCCLPETAPPGDDRLRGLPGGGDGTMAGNDDPVPSRTTVGEDTLRIFGCVNGQHTM